MYLFFNFLRKKKEERKRTGGEKKKRKLQQEKYKDWKYEGVKFSSGR